jgi:rare lipoprotein A
MRKQWPGVCIAAVLLASCSSDDGQQKTMVAPPTPVCNGPVVEISGAEPRFETPNPSANQDYERDGKSYKIVQNPSQFSQAGFAAIYDAEPGSNLTATGEAFDPLQLTAAHPTLPVPSYARITNLANGRMVVVRINDRGPYGNDRVISLSRAAADRLNTSNNTKVRIDPIIVAQDGSMSGPGTVCTTIAKQTYALPALPDLSGNGASQPQPAPDNVRMISNSTLKGENTKPVSSGGFLGAPTPLHAGVLEGSEPAAPAVTTQTTPPVAAAPVVAAPVTHRSRDGADHRARFSTRPRCDISRAGCGQRKLYGAGWRSQRSNPRAAVPAAPGPAIFCAGAGGTKRCCVAYSAWSIYQ